MSQQYDSLKSSQTSDSPEFLNCSSSSVYPKSGRNYIKLNTRGTINIMTEKVVAVLDCCKISYRNSVYLISAIAETLGHDLNSIILNKSTYNEQRKKIREQYAKKRNEVFKDTKIDSIVVHWDGKLIPDSVTCKRVDRLPIIVSNDKISKIISVPALEDGKGVTQANAIFKCLYEWNLTEKVEGVCCNTTNSNLGRIKGAASVLEQLLEKDLLVFACRHHILELLLRDCFEKNLHGTSGPDVPFFKRFKTAWATIDTKNYKPGIENTLNWDFSVKFDDTQKFIDCYLEKQQPRDDYEELLRLSKAFLGPKCDMKFCKPGAYHHARWIAKAIYSLKIYILREVFELSEKEKNGLYNICLFIVIIYIKYWYAAPLAIKAPNNDLNLVKDLFEYKVIDLNTAESSLKKFSIHLWYLNEELCAMSLFDNDMTISTKKKIILAMTKEDKNENVSSKRYMIKNILELEKLKYKDIDFFCNKNSINLFNRFKINTEFLYLNIEDWPNNDSYLKALSFFQNLKVVNDVSERAN